ncbi:alpha-L RNA-binding motif-containing protein [Panus rudis PR-1116 ss-1]|nr:alpha-L RNA-binding motif-containing protein [Panus rudis PR-1116 ss-1]
MRDANLYNFRRALPRMSWSPKNLYNLWRRSLGALTSRTNFKNSPTTLSLFQQRWVSKSLVRAYHGDYINEKTFKRWYLPDTLPDVRPRKSTSDTITLNKWARKDNAASAEAKLREEENSKALAPVGSLMFTEIERRIDVVIFRACMAHSVYEARRMVVHGDVLLNGRKHQNANTRLAPGDMVTVNPKAIRFLTEPPAPKEAETEAKAEETQEAAASETTSEEATAETAEDTTAEACEEPAEAAEAAKEESKEVSTGKPSRPWKKALEGLTPFHLPPYASPFIFIPAYLETSFKTCSVIYLRHPTARPGYSEIPTPYDADGYVVRFAWEWYTRVRPRIRSKRQLARMPENRKAPEEVGL